MSIEIIEEIANRIYTQLGCGHSERIYHNAMEVSLRKRGIQYESERIVSIVFEEHTIGNVRADLIIENNLVVELKSTRNLNQAMNNQAMNYLKLTGIRSGLLINFPQSDSETCEFSIVCL